MRLTSRVIRQCTEQHQLCLFITIDLDVRLPGQKLVLISAPLTGKMPPAVRLPVSEEKNVPQLGPVPEGHAAETEANTETLA